MKRFISGLLVGFFLSIPSLALAEQVSMIGKTVQNEYPVIVDGNQLGVNAIAIDGTSYLPIRALGEATERKVEFRDKKVILTKIETEQPIQEEGGGVSVEVPVQENHYTLETVNEAIENLELDIGVMTKLVESHESEFGSDSPAIKQAKENIKRMQEQLEYLKKVKSELESQQ